MPTPRKANPQERGRNPTCETDAGRSESKNERKDIRIMNTRTIPTPDEIDAVVFGEGELPLAHYAKRLVMIDHQLRDEDQQLARYIALGRVDAVA